MTTYTLTGLAVYYSTTSDDVAGVDNTNVKLELVVNDSTSSFSYTVNPLGPGDDIGDQTVEDNLDAYTVRINGNTANNTSFDPNLSIYQVSWVDGSGSHTSTVLIPFVDGVTVPGFGTVSADYIFVIDGDALPNITSAAAWEAFDPTITAISIPMGTYGPNTDIALTNLGATVKQNDVITGTNSKNVFKSGAGADTVRGKGGNDTLKGEAGNDKLFGDGGNDKIFGGNGDDIGNGGTGDDTVNGDAGKDTLNGGSGIDTMNGGDGNDKVNGDSGNDTINGGNNNDTLNGGTGNDKVNGGNGSDKVNGGDGNDTLKGNSGKDILKGGAGKDTLNGGGGNDKMTGGGKADTFVFSTGTDRITDFNASNNLEKIDLSHVNSIKHFLDLKNNHMSNSNGNVVIESASGDKLILEGLSISDLDKGDFIF